MQIWLFLTCLSLSSASSFVQFGNCTERNRMQLVVEKSFSVSVNWRESEPGKWLWEKKDTSDKNIQLLLHWSFAFPVSFWWYNCTTACDCCCRADTQTHLLHQRAQERKSAVNENAKEREREREASTYDLAFDVPDVNEICSVQWKTDTKSSWVTCFMCLCIKTCDLFLLLLLSLPFSFSSFSSFYTATGVSRDSLIESFISCLSLFLYSFSPPYTEPAVHSISSLHPCHWIHSPVAQLFSFLSTLSTTGLLHCGRHFRERERERNFDTLLALQTCTPLPGSFFLHIISHIHSYPLTVLCNQLLSVISPLVHSDRFFFPSICSLLPLAWLFFLVPFPLLLALVRLVIVFWETLATISDSLAHIPSLPTGREKSERERTMDIGDRTFGG